MDDAAAAVAGVARRTEPMALGGFLPYPYQMAEFVAWLLGAFGVAAVVSAAVGVAGRSRRETWLAAFLLAFLAAGATLAVTNPFGGDLWDLWTVLGGAWAGAVGAGIAILVESFRRRRRATSEQTTGPPDATPRP
jgi:uncharacterized membrane protein HdeD (DUF308 family)